MQRTAISTYKQKEDVKKITWPTKASDLIRKFEVVSLPFSCLGKKKVLLIKFILLYYYYFRIYQVILLQNKY